MEKSFGAGRVAVLDQGETARRVIHAVRELAGANRAGIVALHHPADRQARFTRDADEAVEIGSSIEDALRAARPQTAWIGRASAIERADFAEACAALGIAFIGPSAEALRRLAAPDGVKNLAAQLGIPAAPASGVAAEARLVEVMVARDRAGAARVLGVGDASLRRGDVAVLAESPSPAFAGSSDGETRELAVRAAAAAQWVGVCAVQLLVEPATRRASLVGIEAFGYSAPAVEATAGVDLVRLALRLAAGAALDARTITPQGHAFAARILARDPEDPSTAPPGRVELLRLPSRLGVRADAAVQEGDDAPSVAGGALATVVTRGETRQEALERLGEALADADVLLRGSGSSKAWLAALCARPEVRGAEAGVAFLERLASSKEKLVQLRPEAALLAASIEAYEIELDLERARFLAEARRGRPRVGPSSGRGVELRYAGQRHRLDVRQTGPDLYRVAAGASVAEVRVERLGRLERRLTWNGRRLSVLSVSDGLKQLVEVDGVPHLVQREAAGLVPSPMPAVVVALPVTVGQRVSAGDPVARIESMKVEVAVPAPEDGIVREIVASVNGQVDAGAPLVRIEPIDAGPAQPATSPLSFGSPPEVAPTAAPARYVAALGELRRLLLGFDVAASEAKRLAASFKELSASVSGDDEAALAAEEGALRAFTDLQSLFTRTPSADTQRPPLEELWRYLHEPQSRGQGLSPGFVDLLRRALAHYGVDLEAPGHDLELALLRIQKAHERAGEQLPPVLAILERRLAGGAAPKGFTAPDARELLDRLADLGHERSPALGDLAREVRYRRFDQPALERVRAEVYTQTEADLAQLATASGAEREAAIARLVAIPQPLATLLMSRLAAAPPPLRSRFVETLLRRYYRMRPLGPVTALDQGAVPCAWADYELAGQRYRLAACFAPLASVGAAAKALARLVADAPADREALVELYVWSEGAPAAADALVESVRGALAGAGFARPVRRASVVVAVPGQGLGSTSQHHFTLRGGPADWTEDRRYRGVHPLLFERMQLERLAKFDLERLPSVEDVYLYRGVAQANPKDERLFAAAEVRDLTPVLDQAGKVVQLPQFERMFHEALAGMRRFQARRAPNQRLEWNRVLLTVTPPLRLTREEVSNLAERLSPATEGLGLEMVLIDARVPDAKTGVPRETLLRVVTVEGNVSIRWDEPTDRPLEPMAEYQQKVVQLRRRGLTHPFEIVKMLTPSRQAHASIPPGEFQEYDLDEKNVLVPVQRPPGMNSANIVVGVVKNFTPAYPEGMTRVILLGDPGREMGSVAEPECRRIAAAIDLAEKMGAPLEWLEVCAGAKISMTSGTENMDWVSLVLRRLIEFTQGGGIINVLVLGITVGAQPYWNAEATMLMHTKGILVMAPGSSMVLTGKQSLEYSGSVSAEDNEGIGGYDRIMGPNGQAQYKAGSVAEALQILMRWYDHTYVAPGERFPRRKATNDPRDRDIRTSRHGPEGGAGFTTVGDIFSAEKNGDRKKPFEIRYVMAAAADQDHPPLERWRDLRGGDTGVVWEAHVGGWPVCLIGIQSRPLPRLEFVPADGPEFWSGGTLFPASSKKIARAVNSASGNRPVVVLANLSGFDGSPESMRRLQLEYGAQIGRAVVNFQGPFVFCVVSRYHGGAFVVFAKTLRTDIEIVAVEGARASVIGGAPAAAVVFSREVETRTRKDPRVIEAEKAAAQGGPARARFEEVMATVRSEKLGAVGDEFDKVHSVERALKVGSLDRIISPQDVRPYLIDALERGIAKFTGK